MMTKYIAGRFAIPIIRRSAHTGWTDIDAVIDDPVDGPCTEKDPQGSIEWRLFDRRDGSFFLLSNSIE